MTLEELEQIIATRAAASPDESWTARLLAKGPEKVAEKFGEEAIEALIEAVRGDPDRLASEAADVLFHLLVMLHARGVSVAQVMDELARRQAQSGLAEKAARKT
ncbi:phosphoribosyl-ATP diphosphatase [Lutimaribacter sp. EGI FJ00015]|uniref:Phosphoribosyl-ATP diphosphatase n=1 Tax=Lutimaribacter degradans TaxID=2945989 RepID=A0ACC5ZRK2_9RHOB|nr:phosphoribosyl-ATP diphosphatase [Lutimaribacter sp. EGI FJ00013]MCM2560656.1 phosphoribosyl-ATP diphosphatase [Lutimaribacter sp. EGI FJ00013]MCO0612401.1 phosphoribosyl-ATP diphosphatase [Lutimaribacter sp. EGI FJ00015]MCO0634480.1 phosphoribosyl-ATP diphosphatase [Lutimaribacter sp. EGI FJ00014]